jgi:hypothetical protein
MGLKSYFPHGSKVLSLNGTLQRRGVAMPAYPPWPEVIDGQTAMMSTSCKACRASIPGAIGEPAARQAPRQGYLDRGPSTPRIDALAQAGRRLLNGAPETPCTERKEALHDVSWDTGRCGQRGTSRSRTFNGLGTLNTRDETVRTFVHSDPRWTATEGG